MFVVTKVKSLKRWVNDTLKDLMGTKLPYLHTIILTANISEVVYGEN